MTRSSTPRRPWRTVLPALMLALFLPVLAHAQSVVSGTVSSEAGAPVAGAQVTVVGTSLRATTDAQGAFTIAAVPEGDQQIRVSRTGFQTTTQAVSIRAGEAASAIVTLLPAAVELDALVVSASRQAERITEAPATITRIGTEVLENVVGNNFAAALKEVQGLDYIQVGVSSVAINARGFNSSFNNRMLMMEDGRISVLPENGLPVGQFTPTPKVDLAGMEVLVGPGSALYGADASSGVISLTTKDPRQYQGTTAEITVGSRSYRDVQARQAGVVGNWGYKVAGEYQEAEDFSNRLTILPGSRAREYRPGDETKAGYQPEIGPGGQLGLDWNTSVARGTGALVYYGPSDSRFEVSAGMSQTDAVGQTNVGRNQLDGWQYNFQQAKFSTPRWYANAYRAQSKSGDSYANNRFTGAWYANQAAAPDKKRSDQDLILASDWPSDGRMYAAEVQYNNRLPFLLGTQVIAGGQFRQDVVSSDQQWLTDRLTKEDVSIRQFGAYAQSTTPVAPWMDVVLAARVDDHENYETQFSPKAGVVVKPIRHQAFRVTYNRAFKSPTILQTNFFIPDWTPIVSIYGNTEGYTVKDETGAVFRSFAALQPEENTTWEFGYKGVIRDRLFVDVTHYRSDYTNFISPLAIISDPFGFGLAGQGAGKKVFAYDAQGNLIKTPGGIPPLVLIYYNLGEAELTGTDMGMNFLLTPRVSLKGTLSLVDLKSFDVEAGREEATALNSPELKGTVGLSFTDVANFSGGATLRHVDGYYFRSGVNLGQIPGFTTLDLNVGYRIPQYNTRLNVGVSNLFSCSEKFTFHEETDPRFESPASSGRSCGFDKKHVEMINMPEVGTMLFVGLQFQTK